MKCPHCGGAVESSQRQYQDRQRARGHCPKCGKPHEGRFINCMDCRKRSNTLARARYQRRQGGINA